ncbi:dihydroneopterin aldolase [Burkholderia lata]|uniref:Dihydroneopterin aldolase n=1 Tax=Burkholderia lata (strain ATCC 17760 / DSM 23089 / LMG 22485 / NCIMB 9086 / R18194 / 383) TaxID=482957 RepID=A0A6P2V7K4_BURL3|nr:dihydroneopterin aldolase [Burkholderia lata]VWC77057.1 dihydroneopterin aldolase [Burkholderia lata]
MKTAAILDRQHVPACGAQVLSFVGLRFDATLGVLSHEHEAPQPIAVDVDLNLGTQSLLPQGDDIQNVLDYRLVRQLIIDECRSGHVNLLETLIGKVARRLLCVPGVLGVKVKITKLEIFDDCEVAIRIEAGRW